MSHWETEEYLIMVEVCEKEIQCPYCSSTNVYKPKLSVGAIIISCFMFGFPILLVRKNYHCFECDMDFKRKIK